MRAFAERGYDLVIGVGFAQTPIIEIGRQGLSEDQFRHRRRRRASLPNVASLVFKEHEGSLSRGDDRRARRSKTGMLGFLGGMDIPLIHRFENGYEEGARAVNPKIQVIQNYVGVTDAAWNNPGKGKELSLAQIGKGADVIFAAAGNSGLGAFDAVEQAGRNGRATHFVIGVDSNQNRVKPGFVLTSMVKRVDNAVYHIVERRGRITASRAASTSTAWRTTASATRSTSTTQARLRRRDPPASKTRKKKIIAGEIKVTDAMAK